MREAIVVQFSCTASTLDDDVRLEANAFHSAGMIGRAKSAHDLRLGAGLGSVKDVDLQPTRSHVRSY
jgi:hypothetical protein